MLKGWLRKGVRVDIFILSLDLRELNKEVSKYVYT